MEWGREETEEKVDGRRKKGRVNYLHQLRGIAQFYQHFSYRTITDLVYFTFGFQCIFLQFTRCI